VLGEFDLEMPVTIFLVQTSALVDDGLDLLQTLLFGLFVRRSSALLSMQAVVLVTGVFECLLETTTESRCVRCTI
jgi:hypothetical protein